MTRAIEVLTAVLGVALVVVAVAANQAYLDRHFLPSFFIPRHWYVRIETLVRLFIGLAGAALALARSRVGRVLTTAPGTAARVMLAVVLAIVASEWALRSIGLRPTEWLVAEEEPRRQMDLQLGWVIAPNRTGHRTVAGRTVDYVMDAAGYRVSRPDEPVDVERPTIVFGGESVMFGEGLAWDESIPAQTGALLGIQSANLAVHGYSTDQIYLRLERELPKFRQPIAVVSIFMTELFGRNLDDDRPHLTDGLRWQPAVHSSRLSALAKLLVPFRREATVQRGVRVTHESLRAIVRLARARQATPLVIVPQFGDEDAAQRALRTRILGNDVPSLLIQLDPDWRLAWDRHPNARAAHVIASAIAERLRPSLSTHAAPDAAPSSRY
ncbi:MAG TPA: hypothetical protein VNR64_13385 [Vicinamibacterales bacterium]|nr:hypothetical protein [Vicinamibacterales bacterium]